MRFDVSLRDYEIVPLLSRLIAITGSDPWTKKFSALEQQLNENPFLRDYYNERHGTVLKLRDLLVEQEKTGSFPIPIQDKLQYRLYGFCAGVVRIHEQLSDAGKNRLRGMLNDELKPDNSLLSVQHEIATAVHLVSLGFDVELNDIESGSGVNFIIKRDGVEAEVECKMFTGDVGRQIHKRKVFALYHHLAPTIARTYESTQTGLLIRVTIPGRLTCQSDQLQNITSAIVRGLVNGMSVVRVSDAEVGVMDFPIHTSPFDVNHPNDVSRESVENFTLAKLGRTNSNLFVFFTPRKRALVLLVESMKPDRMLKGIYRQLREACKGQFTTNRPGHLAVQFQDLTAEDMETLATDSASTDGKPTGLQLMTEALLQSSNSKHIHSVAYRSHGTLLRQQGEAPELTEHGVGWCIKNPANSHYEDPRLRLMR